MTDGFRAESESLRQMAESLRESTSAVDSAASSAPPPPEVTISSENVGFTISEVLKGVGAVVAGIEKAAEDIHTADGSYAETDNRNSEDFSDLPKFGR